MGVWEVIEKEIKKFDDKSKWKLEYENMTLGLYGTDKNILNSIRNNLEPIVTFTEISDNLDVRENFKISCSYYDGDIDFVKKLIGKKKV